MARLPILSRYQSLYSWRMTIDPAGRRAAGLQLRVRTPDSDRLLDGGASYRVGRDPQSDIVLADPRVSWEHAVLRHQDGGWLLEDTGSTNGTFVDSQRVRQVTIAADCFIRLG